MYSYYCEPVGAMYSYCEPVGDSEDSVQHGLMLQRLQRSQIDNALIRNKAQRFIALKTLRRSVELRRQLQQQQQLPQQERKQRPQQQQQQRPQQQQQQQQQQLAGATSVEESTASPLDPSVKALIKKLTEIADLLPYGCRGDQAPLDHRPPQRQQQNNDASCSKQDETVLLGPSGTNNIITTATTATGHEESSIGPQAPQNVPKTAASKDDDKLDGSNQDEARLDVNNGDDAAVTRGAALQDEGKSTIDNSHGDSTASLLLSNEGYVDPLDLALHQQLLDLDSDVASLFQNIEDPQQTAKTGKGSELVKKTGARKNAAAEGDAQKKLDEIARKKERAALLAQLESITEGKQHRLPKWRWAAQGVDNPDPDRVLKGKLLWRAAVLLVIVFFVRPKRHLMERKSRSKDRDTQDWNATLTIYFNRCQTWLLKATRVPVGNSLLKSNTLNFRLSHVDNKMEAYGINSQRTGIGGGGFVSTFLKRVALGANHDSLALTLTRLKVHVKGVLEGLTQEMPPSDIMTFFSYLACDGNYFPDGFFFDEETRVLSFDDLGAVRNLAASTDPPDTMEDTIYALHPSGELGAELLADAEGRHGGFLEAHHLGWLVHAAPNLGKGGAAEKPGNASLMARSTDLRTAVLHGRSALPGKLRPVYRHDASGQWLDTSLVEMVLTNYLMVRVLIPWILLYPRESGLTPSSSLKPSTLTHNCQVLASTVYLIVRVLRPELTPPNADTMRAAIIEETERAAKVAAAGDMGDEEGEGGNKHLESDDSEESESDDESNEDETQNQGNGEGKSPGSKYPDGNRGGRRTKNKNLAGIRRRLSLAVRGPLRPRTVREIMQQKRYVSVSDKQLLPALLPDAYFLPFAEQMRPWVLEFAAEFDGWVQRVIAKVMRKVEGSATRHGKASNA